MSCIHSCIQKASPRLPWKTDTYYIDIDKTKRRKEEMGIHPHT